MAGAVSKVKLAAPVFLLQTDFLPEVSPLTRLCGPVRGFRSWSNQPLVTIPPPLAVFAGRLEKQDFFEAVWAI